MESLKGKELSCGVVYTDGEQLLGCHPYGPRTRQLDIPKGRIEPGETPIEAAVRELYEETSLKISPSELMDVGRQAYTAFKDLHVFLYITDTLPSIDELACLTTFELKSGRRVPEVVRYSITTFDDSRYYRGLQPILQYIKSELIPA